MKINELKDLTEQELIMEAKKRKAIYIAFSCIIGLMIVASIYGYFQKGFSFFTIMPIIFFPMYLTNMKNYNEAKNELKSRNLK